MAFSFLFGRGHGALALQFVNQCDNLGKEFDQPGAGAPEPAVALCHSLPFGPLALGHCTHAFAALLWNRQDPALVQMAVLAVAALLAALASQFVDIPPDKRPVLH